MSTTLIKFLLLVHIISLTQALVVSASEKGESDIDETDVTEVADARSLLGSIEEVESKAGEESTDEVVHDLRGNIPPTKSNPLKDIIDSGNVILIKSKDIVKGKKKIPSPSAMRRTVETDNKVIAIDFTDTRGTKDAKKAKKKTLKKLGVFFECDLLLATKYNGGLMYTPIPDVNSDELQPMLNTSTLIEMIEREKMKGLQNVSDDGTNKWKTVPPSTRSTSSGQQPIPNIAFYVNFQYHIPAQKCAFKASVNNLRNGNAYFCQNPHITLIFQVNFQRSLRHSASGSSTPDSKIVRISSDENTGGAGFHLNNELNTLISYNPDKTVQYVGNDWWRDFASSAIAKDYYVQIQASNKKASLLKTVPRSNMNPGVTVTETSGYTVGVTAGAEAGKDGPKASLAASASYTQSRTMKIETHDYKLQRLSSGAQHIKFRMVRETYPKGSDLLSRSTATLFEDDVIPFDLKRVEPMGYQTYVPKFDTIFIASPTASGLTEFTIEASVGIMPLYHATYCYFYGVGAHFTFYGEDQDRDGGRASISKTFTVDWDHAVFTGGRPVNLQPKAFPNKCITTNERGIISFQTTKLTSIAQSFIRDEYGRYKSVLNTNKCLDALDLEMLADCTGTLTQRWEWEKGTDKLGNEFHTDKILGVDKRAGRLRLYPKSTQNDDAVNVDIESVFTDVFDAKGNELTEAIGL